MPYEQVRDILGRVRLFHRQVVDYFDGEDACSVNERTKELIGAFRLEETAMDRAIGQFVKEGRDDRALGVWIQYVADEDVRRVLKDLRTSGTMQPEELMDLKLDFDHALIGLYSQLAGSTSFPEVSELFDGLRRMTEQRSAQSVWSARDE